MFYGGKSNVWDLPSRQNTNNGGQNLTQINNVCVFKGRKVGNSPRFALSLDHSNHACVVIKSKLELSVSDFLV